jgi:hypothetical protein
MGCAPPPHDHRAQGACTRAHRHDGRMPAWRSQSSSLTRRAACSTSPYRSRARRLTLPCHAIITGSPLSTRPATALMLPSSLSTTTAISRRWQRHLQSVSPLSAESPSANSRPGKKKRCAGREQECGAGAAPQRLCCWCEELMDTAHRGIRSARSGRPQAPAPEFWLQEPALPGKASGLGPNSARRRRMIPARCRARATRKG